MVDKISLNVKFAGLNVEHSFLVPSEMNVTDATNLIVQALSIEYPGTRGSVPGSHMLLQTTSGKVLNQTCSFRQLGIVQGEKMILI